MDSLFARIFGCCLRSSNEKSDEPDEQTRLIQPTDEVPPNNVNVVDINKMRERLGSIVRSKEGKMVNVNTPLPFNLHNKSLHQRLDILATRSDHSLSGRSSPFNPAASTSHAHIGGDPSVIPHVGAARALSLSLSRESSPSLETSRSTTSLYPGDASYLPPDEDPENGLRKPILNVRLVRNRSSVSQAYGIKMRQGRSVTRGRTGRFGDDPGGREAVDTVPEERGSVNLPITVTMEGQDRPPTGPFAAHEAPSSPEQGDGQDDATPTNDTAKFLLREEDPGTISPVVPSFKIQDVGKISQSWGD